MARSGVSLLLDGAAVGLTLLSVLAAVVCRCASFVAPDEGNFWASVALSMPVVLVVNGAFLVGWLIWRRWRVALLPLAALVINGGYLAAMFQIPSSEPKGDSDLTVATLNAYAFRRLGSVASTVERVAEVIAREQVGIFCIQEFSADGKIARRTLFHYFPQLRYHVEQDDQAILSRYPILRHHYVRFPDSSNNYLEADLRIGRDTVRVFSVHLQTSGIAALRARYRQKSQRVVPVEQVVGVLEHNSRIRVRQVKELRSLIDASPYPVIVAGDFNDTPSSFAYRHLRGDLTDGFREAGAGFASTFRPMFGVLRIDYIFYDKRFEGVDYVALRDDLSDHRAVVARLRFDSGLGREER